MSRIKKILFIVVLTMLICNASCQKNNPQTDSEYEFTLNEERKEETISSIDRTKPNEILTYKQESDNGLIITTYYFNEGYSSTKVIYKFYNNLDDFRVSLLNHSDNLDGSFMEVTESILLVKSQYVRIDKVSFDQLYNQIKDKYVII